ncbi:YpmA family protein [Dehalobacterium formicoaceticum]|uniref:YpmA family protein n=1 Tax=Dehalobacterium formicoaceticum TaxID=51515 RepID=A0ABT1Y8B9_9FIRM|nr:YpmA family protein [Dehalobacterium formicoaceticum]MCR6546325.1 YpmA family protein [Dehalobacterium formicoaceticum]
MDETNIETDHKTSGKMELIAVKDFAAWDDMYQVVDFLNKSLKAHNLMFGLRKGDSAAMTITIYEV